MTKDVIEINGRHYNAQTGEFVGANNTSGKASKVSVKVSEAKPKIATKNRQAAKHAQPHAQNSSKLLMRRAVKKPTKQLSSIKSHSTLAAKPVSKLSPSHRVEKRLDHASKVHKSQNISHFVRSSSMPYPETVIHPKSFDNDPYQLTVTHIPVAEHPGQRSRQQSTSDMLEAALQAATSHEAKPLPRRAAKKHRRLFGRLRTA